MPIQLTAVQRSAIKAQIHAAMTKAAPADLADLRSTYRGWTRDQIVANARRFGVPLPSDAPETEDAPETDTAPETLPDTAPASAPATLSDAAQADVATLDRLWASMDVNAYRAAVQTLAARANEDKTIIVQAAPVQIGNAPASHRIGNKRAGDIFPSLNGFQAGDIMLPIYDAPDAPMMDKHFAFPPTLGAILSRTVKRGKGVFLSGPPGTGKSTLCEQIAARLSRPFVRVSCNANTDAATLVGMTVPSKDGGTEFQPGILTHAISRPGVVLLIDEPSTARDGILYVLQSLLDDAKRIFVDECGGMVYPLAPDALIFLADNTDGTGDGTGAYAGTRMLSRALLSRVTMIRMDYMPETLERRTLQARTGASANLAGLLVTFANLARVKVTNGELPTPVDFRQLTAWAELLIDGTTPQDAAEIAFLNSAGADAREILQQLLTTHCAPEHIKQAI